MATPQVISKLLRLLLCKHHILYYTLLCWSPVLVVSQNTHFPAQYNVARHQPVTTVPSQAACGVTSTSAFCQSTTTYDYVTTCIPEFCWQACPWRTQLPAATDLMDALGYGVCVSPDNIMLRPYSHAATISTHFLPGTRCYLTPRATIALGTESSMTLTFWIWQERENAGTVIEKWTTEGTLFRLTISQYLVKVDYNTALGSRVELLLPDNIPPNAWNFIAIQVHSTTLSLFINGLSLSYAAAVTTTLSQPIQDQNGNLRVGSDANGQNQFLGWIQEMKFYGETLSNRDIELLYTGTLPELPIDSDCRCPPSHPRVKPTDTIYCIPNGVMDNTGQQLRRLNERAHPLGYLNDGNAMSFFVSNFLDDLTVMIDFGNEFSVFSVHLEYYSPQAELLTISRCREVVCSSWSTWQYYARDCIAAFAMPNNGPLTTSTAVNCIQFGSNGVPVPYSRGNVTYRILAALEPVQRPGHDAFYTTPALQEFVKARQIRFRMQNHYYVTNDRHKYYGIYEINVQGRCECNGHAESCDTTVSPYLCRCVQSSRTEGDQCERCSPLYNDKPFRAGTLSETYPCKPCECHSHADSCVYNPTLDPYSEEYERGSGGVCQNCQHNTEGRFCNQCINNHYRPTGRDLSAENVCEPCNCNESGTSPTATFCDKTGGQCVCRANVGGRDCSFCLPGFFNLQMANPLGCEGCMCNSAGTINGDDSCDATRGQCNCKENVQGTKCDVCRPDYYGLNEAFPEQCTPCDCVPQRSLSTVCDAFTGQCECKPNQGGRQCEQCMDGYVFDESSLACVPCSCAAAGSTSTTCDPVTGECQCARYYGGPNCETCAAESYFNTAQEICTGCLCDPSGSVLENDRIVCQENGDCVCKSNSNMIPNCRTCNIDAFNIQRENPEGCTLCPCDFTGTELGSDGRHCDTNNGQCNCRSLRRGADCGSCPAGYFKSDVPMGCELCECVRGNTVDADTTTDLCDENTGDCTCIIGYTGRTCGQCVDAYYMNPQNKCVPCNCAEAGTITGSFCDASTGQCACKSNVQGLHCDQCVAGSSNLQASNPDGCSSVPSQQPPPEASFINATAILLFWDPPDNPNGLIVSYRLYRNSILLVEILAPTEGESMIDADARTYLDMNLEPYTQYSYRIQARNEISATWSPIVTYMTEPAAPAGEFTLLSHSITNRSVSFQWSQPSFANGIIQGYDIYAAQYNPSEQTSLGPTSVWDGLGRAATIHGLIPYTNYTFYVEACTPGGCLQSDKKIIIMLPALPQQQEAPSLSSLIGRDENFLMNVEWDYPAYPNGVIYFYEVWLRGTADENDQHNPGVRRVFTSAGTYDPLDPHNPAHTAPVRSFQITALEPYKYYDVRVIVENSVGKAASEWVSRQTSASAPVFMPPPVIVTLNSSHVNVTWRSPTPEEARGAVVYFYVHRYDPETLDSVFRAQVYPQNAGKYIDGPFSPYTPLTYAIELTNELYEDGMILSAYSQGRTGIAAPAELLDPVVEGTNSTIMGVHWEEPLQPNGPSPNYLVRRSEVAFSQPPPLVEHGTRFVGFGYYKFPPETIPQGVTFTGIDFWFRTTQTSALLFFATSEAQQEFVLIQLNNKRPWFIFDPQGCVTALSPAPGSAGDVDVSDGKWHHLQVQRLGASGLMFLDGNSAGCTHMVTPTDDEGLAYSDGEWYHLKAWRQDHIGSIIMEGPSGRFTGNFTEPSCNSGNIIGNNTGLYVGGLPEDYVLSRIEQDSRAEVIKESFVGCLRDVKILTQKNPREIWTPLDWSTAAARYGVMPRWESCPTDVNDAMAHFIGNGYVSLDVTQFPSFVPSANSVEVTVKTLKKDAFLISFLADEDIYFVVQIIDGILTWSFRNPDVAYNHSYPQLSNYNFCNGQEYRIKLDFFKTEPEATIKLQIEAVPIDEYSYIPGHLDSRDPANFMSMSGLREVMVGGIAPGSDTDTVLRAAHNILQLTPPLAGCMLQAVKVSYKTVKLKEATSSRNVFFDGCPENPSVENTCVSETIEQIYEGSQRETEDHDLLPFTEYMYQVGAYNEFGYTYSPWSVGRTREGAPVGLSPPTLVEVRSGSEIYAEWLAPTGRTGQLLEYQLLAYDVSDPDTPPVQLVTNSTVLNGTITDAVPFTAYRISLIACTWGGCTESEPYPSSVMTDATVPGDVGSPRVAESGPTYLALEWDEPGMPNGVLTGYTLYQGAAVLYSGTLRTYNVTELSPYTPYLFSLTTCSSAGCSRSEEVSLLTDELAPLGVLPPTLTVLGSHRIRADWVDPDIANGNLQRYELYASSVFEELGELMWNDTVLNDRHFTMSGLLAGTTYYVSLVACTGGGCTASDAAIGITAETSPEGIPDPVVVSPSPTQLIVSWQQPELPNGVIDRYYLYHNNLRMYEATQPGEYFIDNLLPWSYHTFQIEVCTTADCGRSDIVEVRTMEATPVGVVGLTAQALGPREVRLEWTSVDQPNGLITYDAYFEGPFYVNYEHGDFSTLTARRSLYSSEESGVAVVSGLLPWPSVYTVQINASNTQAYILSNTQTATMTMGAPDGVAPPVLTSPTSTSVRATWMPVGRNNADEEPVFQLQFQETAPGSQVQDLFLSPTTSTTFLKEGLEPFTDYEFRLIASNNYGETQTVWTRITTRQDVPGSIDPPILTEIMSRSIRLTWHPPSSPNGILISYEIFQNNVRRQEPISANITSLVADGLTPYTAYQFQVAACTIAGCSTSMPSTSVHTLKAPPEGMSAPTLLSETPTSVLLVWDPPESPNGVILTYSIERRLTGNSEISDVATVPAAQRQFTDQSPEISPYTSYEYRIIASTEDGDGVSPWAEVNTRSSTPGGVQPPTVIVLNATSLNISWEPPISPNGVIESYTLKLPTPRFEIRDPEQTNLIVASLVPYTQYFVSVIACTDGGCTESTRTVATTRPSIPVGLAPPIATPHSQTFISLLWQPPENANGPNLRYELSRTKVAQPLDSTATDFGSWTSLYNGPNRYFEDRGLTIFTTYQYRVTVYNDFGQLTSEPSEEVITFGGTPSVRPSLFASAVNHTALQVSWDTPSVFELQGGVSVYKLGITSEEPSYDAQHEYGADAPSTIILGDLTPVTSFTLTLTLLMHGGASISSAPVVATTLEGAPEGLAPPRLLTIDDTALRILWTAPEYPNGEVMGYYIYLDGTRIDTEMRQPGSYLLENLQPYVVYTIQLEVCTMFGCVRSDEVIGSTAEVVPGGVAAPTVIVQGATSTRVSWTTPAEPNGIILQYELFRKAYVPCTDISPTTSEPINSRCVYVQCAVQETLCGRTCYTGQKTCCAGVLYDNRMGFECCGSDYVPQRNNQNDVCCGGKFYTRRNNYQCCRNRYVEVREGEICCPDPNEDRVDVGPGDQCCGSVPYSSGGAQVCCNDVLQDGYQQQCCGGTMLPDDLVCCGNATLGTTYPHQESQFCCGQEYVDMQTTACCSGLDGTTQAHQYDTYIDMISANEKCCGTQRISNSLSCCNNVGYNPITQSCADMSDGLSGCGSGTVCPISQSASAYCDQCDFNPTQSRCGSATPQLEEPDVTLPADYCWTAPIRIYAGLDFIYVDEGLRPFSRYEYSVSAVNGAGSGLSEYRSVLTRPSIPDAVDPPEATIDPNRLDTIQLNWSPPRVPNGEVIQYHLYRDTVEIFRHPSAIQYTDTNNIQPYQTYSYVLSACTVEGCTDSQPVPVATLQAAPEEVSPPDLSALSSTSIQVTWSEPGRPNGFITLYQLISSTLEQSWELSSSTRTQTVSGLEPFTQYTFMLMVCTEAGCTNSTAVNGYTQQDWPLDLAPVNYVVLSPTSVEIHWRSPLYPNGDIELYKLYRSQASNNAYIRVYEGSPNVFMQVDDRLQASTRYYYKVSASNGAGTVNSTASYVNMPQDAPVDIPAPVVGTITATSLSLSWAAPSGTALADIDQFRVLLNAGTADEYSYSAGTGTSFTVINLTPYTEYKVRIMACLKGVENGCATGPQTLAFTMEATPEELAAPTLTARGPSVLHVEWEPPSRPNGEILRYYIHRRQGGDTGNGLLIQIVGGSMTSFSNAGPELVAFHVYEYRVMAENAIGSVTSDWASVRTLEDAPRGMSQPTILQIGAFSMQVSWSPPSSLNGILTQYRLEWRKANVDPTRPVPLSSANTGPGVTLTSISGLTPHTEYQLRVVGMNSAGEAASAWIVTTTNQAAPAELSAFRVDYISTGTSVILRWDPPGQPNGIITNYLVFESGNINAVYQGLSREFQYSRLQPFTAYLVQLEACTLGGCSRSPPQTFTTAEVAPSNLPAPTVGSVASDQVALSWTPPVNPNGQVLLYQVLRQSSAIARRRRRQTDDENSVVVYETDQTEEEEYTFTDSGLQPYTRYMYKVRAVNSQGSTDSPWQIVETEQAAPLGLDPPIVIHVPNTHNQLDITWSPPARANGILNNYLLQRNDSVPWSISPNDPLSYRDSGLTAYTTYAYTVTAYTAGGQTTSDPTIVTTPESAPYYIDPPNVLATSFSSIHVTWQEPQITNGRIKEFRLQVDGSVIYVGLDLDYTVNNLTPFQLYTFVLVACTFGGCTSSDAVTGRPLEAIPADLGAPVLRVIGSNSIEVTWQPPSSPNGIITSYEVHRDGRLRDSTSGLLYIDYEVQPGVEYTYRVTAVNSRGSVESPPAAATTYSSSPEGMAPPDLQALSPISIRATWSPPLQPNGDIINYKLWQDVNNDPVYTGVSLTFVVTDLRPWVMYAFYVEACTASGCRRSQAASLRTLEATPEGLDQPVLLAIADVDGTHNGVQVDWEEPQHPNGVIIYYEIWRRDTGGTDQKKMYSGLELSYLDQDAALLPYTSYEYWIVASNSAGATTSAVADVLTLPDAPTSVSPPQVYRTTHDSITLEISEPSEINGRIERYHVFLDGIENQIRLVTQGSSILVDIPNLTPHTTYEIYISACTISGSPGSCTDSDTITATTGSIAPDGLSALRLTNVTSTSITLEWDAPTVPNGEIQNYELSWRRKCPPPYDLADLDIPCSDGPWLSADRGRDLLTSEVTALMSYTKYEFRLEVENEAGVSDPVTKETNTLSAPPAYIATTPLRLLPSGTAVQVYWIESFAINGDITEFLLYVDNRLDFRGIAASHDVVRDPLDHTYHFQVKLRTNMGEAETPVFTYSNDGEVGVVTPTSPGAAASSTTPVYEEVWFIVLIFILLIFLIILIVFCCMRCTKTSRPYIRERAPLQPHQMKTPLTSPYVIDPYNGSMISTEIPRPASQLSHAPSSVIHPGYVNPAYSHLSLASRTTSLVDLNLDKMSIKSSKWDEDEPDWDVPGHLPPDSGLHSLAYGEEYDGTSDRPISVLKEHTMFTDTHI